MTSVFLYLFLCVFVAAVLLYLVYATEKHGQAKLDEFVKLHNLRAAKLAASESGEKRS
jgi:hypothetical protein